MMYAVRWWIQLSTRADRKHADISCFIVRDQSEPAGILDTDVRWICSARRLFVQNMKLPVRVCGKDVYAAAWPTFEFFRFTQSIDRS
jgi:hypothetical protein